ncbi:MAG: cytochrome c biogenesis protein CcsA [Bryobacterales bacterium]
MDRRPYTFVSVFLARRKHANMINYVVAIQSTILAFFLGIRGLPGEPVQGAHVGPQVASVPDGNAGSTPCCNIRLMAIHPADALPGLCRVRGAVRVRHGVADYAPTGRPLDPTTRVWTMVTWMFQSIGILLGMVWAYSVLGWGGYWGWDPVENASLLPWITGTAFLHSVMMQEKKGHAQGLEHRSGLGYVLPLHLRHHAHALGAGQLRPRLRAVEHRRLLRLVPGWALHDHLADSQPAGLPPKSEAQLDSGPLARIELLVQ